MSLLKVNFACQYSFFLARLKLVTLVGRRHVFLESFFKLVSLGLVVGVLGAFAFLLIQIFVRGLEGLTLSFLLGFPSPSPDRAGVLPALIGSLVLVVVTILITTPLALATALYLEEYSPPPKLARLMEINLITLAGTPSILFGLLGLHFFVRQMGLGRSIIAAALTLALLVLPVVITVAREALRQVPIGVREGALALGASRWQVIINHLLPAATPAIFTGCFLAFARVIGETAPLLAIGAYAYIGFVPTSLFDSFTALPLAVFSWLNRPQEAFHVIAASAIILLLALVAILNGISWSIRYMCSLNSRG